MKEQIENFIQWMTYTIQTKAANDGVDLNKLNYEELSKYAFEVVTEKME